jgi:ribonuclease HIII
MTQKQDQVVSQLQAYMEENGLELVEKREIDYGLQLRITDGTDVCPVNVYTSGKVTVGGKVTALRQRLEEWKNLQQAKVQTLVEQDIEGAAQNRTTKFIVAQAKIDKIASLIRGMPGEITWRKGDLTGAQIYQAEIRTDGDKVVVTQYRTGTLMVQGRASPLFYQVCDGLDQKLSQSIADRATRYIPEENRQAALERMCQPDSEATALNWLVEQLGQDLYDFLYPHDRETLLSGAALLEAVRTTELKLPDYSVLVMPFVRAYEGFLIRLFVHIGKVEEAQIERHMGSIQVGNWLNELKDLIVDSGRYGYLVSDLKTAWEGSRHLMVHSDPARQVRMRTLDEAQSEICGALMRAFRRGFDNFVKQPIELRHWKKAKKSTQRQQKRTAKVEGIDEAHLLERLAAKGCTVEYHGNQEHANKWRVMTERWQVFCPRDPGDTIVITGEGQEEFLEWFHGDEDAAKRPVASSLPAIEAHIGVDEAGKGDYFGPLTVAAVYVTAESALDLIRSGVRDSKTMSDATIAELALEIRDQCPNVVIVLMPPEYNAAYQRHQNLNRLLAELHAQAIDALVKQTNCRQVVDDQFAAPHVLEEALQEQDVSVDLEQRTGGESDVAVAAASILARESFVAAIEDLRAKSEMDIPLGSSSPRVIEIGQTIVSRWGPQALERIAKLNFKTTEKILKRR